MPTFKVSSVNPNKEAIIVEASDEQNARRLAMIKWYGSVPDDITPHAPEYSGLGLDVVEVAHG